MIEIDIYRVGRHWRYLIRTVRKERNEPRLMKLGLPSEQAAIREAKKMLPAIIKPCEEVRWYRK